MKLLFCLLLALKVFAGSLEIYSYNVENLFDVSHDDKKEDWTFLPKNTPGKSDYCKTVSSKYRREECYQTDWTSEKLKLKIANIKKVITNEGKSLPDMTALIEVENEKVVKQLADAVGYKKIAITNSPDERGVDVALMFNETKDLKFIKQSEIVLKDGYFAKRPTRNILEVEFELSGTKGKEKLHVFVNHWPSLGNPDEARELAAKALKSRSEEILKSNKDANIIAMGDFNTIDKLKKADSVHPFNEILLKDNFFADIGAKFEEKNAKAKLEELMPPGTYYYDRGGEWNKLDRFFANQNLVDGKNVEVDISSYKIFAPDFIKNLSFLKNIEDQKSMPSKKELMQKGYPQRYDFEKSEQMKVGFSDHFPIVIKISY